METIAADCKVYANEFVVIPAMDVCIELLV